jgi:hypothetical protein
VVRRKPIVNGKIRPIQSGIGEAYLRAGHFVLIAPLQATAIVATI